MPPDRSDRASSQHRWRPPPVRPRLALFGAAAAAALAGVLIAYTIDAESPSVASALDQPAPTATWSPQPPVGTAPVAAVAPPPAVPNGSGQAPAWLKPANDKTPTLSLAELQELRDTLATASNPDDEFTRLTEQMLLADATRRFLQLRSTPGASVEELHGLVDVIGPLLDAQLKRGELTRADAIDLKLKLLQVHFPQASMQQGELNRWLATRTGR